MSNEEKKFNVVELLPLNDPAAIRQMDIENDTDLEGHDVQHMVITDPTSGDVILEQAVTLTADGLSGEHTKLNARPVGDSYDVMERKFVDSSVWKEKLDELGDDVDRTFEIKTLLSRYRPVVRCSFMVDTDKSEGDTSSSARIVAFWGVLISGPRSPEWMSVIRKGIDDDEATDAEVLTICPSSEMISAREGVIYLPKDIWTDERQKLVSDLIGTEFKLDDHILIMAEYREGPGFIIDSTFDALGMMSLYAAEDTERNLAMSEIGSVLDDIKANIQMAQAGPPAEA